MLIFTNSLSIIFNLLEMMNISLFGFILPQHIVIKTNRGIYYSTFMFFAQAPFYFVCLMYALIGYNSRHELCFHCKYAFFFLQTVSVFLVTFFLLNSLPWLSFISAILIFVGVIVVRQLGIDERKKKHEYKM